MRQIVGDLDFRGETRDVSERGDRGQYQGRNFMAGCHVFMMLDTRVNVSFVENVVSPNSLNKSERKSNV